MATNTIEPSDILSRLEMPMTPAVAESVLEWRFTSQSKDQMNDLAEKARQGRLTPDEEAAVNMFERLNNGLGVLKSRARQLLKHGSDSSAT